MGSRDEDGGRDSGEREATLSWEWKARHILTDRFVLADFVTVMSIAGSAMCLLLSSIMIFQGDWDAAGRMAVFALVMTGAVAVLFLLIMLVIGGRFRYRFEIDEDAVTFTVLSGCVKTSNRLAVALGVLARRPGLTGAGLLAKSEEYNRIAFADLSTVRYYPKDHVIFLRARCNPKPIRLYCPPQAYPEAADRIRRGFARGRNRQKQEGRALGPSPVPRRMAATCAALAASLFLLAAPFDIPPGIALGMAALAVAAIWIPPAGKPVGGLLCLGSLGFVLYIARALVTVNVTTTEEQFRAFAASRGVALNEAVRLDNTFLGNYAPYELFDPERWTFFALAVLGALVLAFVGLTAFRAGYARRRPGISG
ncbi:hypothetical protein G3N56_07225 [Desulfovibrio sulfodismutans]|uniref:Uncharacterized protein n=1 Tax=Desulfolutivibrio sulfodismutans TaxID=63561 RepID=A0A7K3NK20_9BACT|nr:hypothetical protein [Desulfolutivibrio sulfodismutans]NDY56532.1 hypothetical protein [Desulfolutivibrio sulfodismutans]QLA12621.1 hypothetical protein GD606_10225 [Desulfolutivibrio sulfodismutans DSM 3696]